MQLTFVPSNVNSVHILPSGEVVTVFTFVPNNRNAHQHYVPDPIVIFLESVEDGWVYVSCEQC